MPAPDLNSIKKTAACLSLKFYDNITPGELAEWSNAAVLKTVEPKGSRGSNPLLSAKKKNPSPKYGVKISFKIYRYATNSFKA
jgi:hypothetical protein